MGDLLGKLVKSLAYSMGKELVKEGVSRIRDLEENDEDIPKHPSNCLKRWLKAFKSAPEGVIIIAGKQGGGKSALCYAMAQYTNRHPIYVITVASTLLPGTKPVPCIDSVPHGAVCVIDDASYFYASIKKGSANSHKIIQDLIIFARKMDICFIFNTQNLGLLDLDVVRQCKALIFKEPGLMQAETERRGVKKYIEKAVMIFQKIPVLQRKKAYYLISDDCEAVGNNGLPAGWNQQISTSIGNITEAEYKIVEEDKAKESQREKPKENIIDELKNKEKIEKAQAKEKALLIKNEYCPECKSAGLKVYETYWSCLNCHAKGAIK